MLTLGYVLKKNGHVLFLPLLPPFPLTLARNGMGFGARDQNHTLKMQRHSTKPWISACCV